MIENAKPRLALADYERAARALYCDVAAIMAVARVESRGDGFLPDGRPKVLFEGQYFYKFTGGAYSSSHPTICYASCTAQHYIGGAAEWDKRLAVAMQLNRDAAIKSASFGKFQVMGFNYADAFGSISEFFDAMHESEGRHLEAFLGFVRANNLVRHIRARNWDAFAYGYNGPGYRANNYHVKLRDECAAAERELGAANVSAPVAPVVAASTLRRGDHGDAVERLQRALVAKGYHLQIDGDFGPATELAVKQQQRANGLVVDGICGPATWAKCAN